MEIVRVLQNGQSLTQEEVQSNAIVYDGNNVVIFNEKELELFNLYKSFMIRDHIDASLGVNDKSFF